MPALLSIFDYIKFGLAAIVSTAAGSHCVYMIYKPVENFGELVEKEVAEIRQQIAAEKKRLAEAAAT